MVYTSGILSLQGYEEIRRGGEGHLSRRGAPGAPHGALARTGPCAEGSARKGARGSCWRARLPMGRLQGESGNGGVDSGGFAGIVARDTAHQTGMAGLPLARRRAAGFLPAGVAPLVAGSENTKRENEGKGKMENGGQKGIGTPLGPKFH